LLVCIAVKYGTIFKRSAPGALKFGYPCALSLRELSILEVTIKSFAANPTEIPSGLLL